MGKAMKCCLELVGTSPVVVRDKMADPYQPGDVLLVEMACLQELVGTALGEDEETAA